jgi:hypothetical protein
LLKQYRDEPSNNTNNDSDTNKHRFVTVCAVGRLQLADVATLDGGSGDSSEFIAECWRKSCSLWI